MKFSISGPFSISGSGTILVGAAGAPIGKWPVTFQVCSLIVLLTEAKTVVPTVPGAVPLEISLSFGEVEDQNSDVDLIAD